MANIDLAGEITIDGLSTDPGLGGLVGWLHKESNDSQKLMYVINVVSDVDITVTNCAKQPRAGAVIGYAFRATVENVVNNGDILIQGTGTSRVGGIVGQTNRATYRNCVNNGKVTADQGTTAVTARAGGIASVVTRGGAKGDEETAVWTVFENCVNNGEISVICANTAIAGGMVADYYVDTTRWAGKDVRVRFTDCANTGSVTASTTHASSYAHAGGVGGYAGNGQHYFELSGCVNSGTITSISVAASKRAGDIFGSVYSPNVTSADTFKFDKCIGLGDLKGGCFSLKDADTALATCTPNAELAVAQAAAKSISDAVTPSTINIAGFATGYVAPEIIPDPNPNPDTGDVTSVIILALVASCAGAVLTLKKVR